MKNILSFRNTGLGIITTALLICSAGPLCAQNNSRVLPVFEKSHVTHMTSINFVSESDAVDGRSDERAVTTYWYPDIKGVDLGWDGTTGAGEHQYHVADSFCIWKGHPGYDNIALNGTQSNGEFATFDSSGDLEYLDQNYYGYIKINCEDL